MKVFDFYDCFELLKKYNIEYLPEYKYVKSEEEIKDFLRKYKKIVFKKTGIIHKTEKNAIKFIFNEDDIINDHGVVMPYIDGLEIFLSIFYDDQLGYVGSIGLGGIYIELIKNVNYFYISKESFFRSLSKNLLYKFLEGYRNKRINFNEIYNLIEKIYEISRKEKLKVIEINPLIYSFNHRRPYIVDCRIEK